MSQIELGKEGFKLSYQRYLSDAVTGLVFISFFIVAFINKWKLPFVGDEWRTTFQNSVGTESQIAFLIFLFLIAPSVGLSLSAISWFFLGTPLIRLMWIWHKLSKLKWIGFPLRLLTDATDRSYDKQNLLEFFNVDNSTPVFKQRTKNRTDETASEQTDASAQPAETETSENIDIKGASENLYDVSNYYEQLVIFYFPAYFASQMEYVQGSRRLFRTIVLLLFSLGLYFWWAGFGFYSILQCLLSAVFLLLFTSLIEYYQAMKMLFMVYSLVMDRDDKPAPLERKEIAKLLVETRTRLFDTG